MMEFSPLDEDKYEVILRRIAYLKIFPFILEDFLCREDTKEIMKPNNLPVTTTVSTAVNTAVTAPTGSGTGVGKGTGSGTGNTQVIYTGNKAHANSLLLKKQRKAELEAGGKTIEGLTSSIKNTMEV